MIEHLTAARDLLRSALDQYLNVCLFIDKSYVDGCLPESTLLPLMNSLSDELSSASIYERALLEARVAIASVRNRSGRIVPLNRLPTDILILIFQFVTIEQNCLQNGKNGESRHKSPKYPSLLTHVCSRWRQVATAAKDLWTHVDLPWYSPDEEPPAGRIEELILHSGRWPLDIHVIEPRASPRRARPRWDTIASLLAPISPRIQSLSLDLGRPSAIPRFWSRRTVFSRILDACFVNSHPGTLTRLAIGRGSMSGAYLIETRGPRVRLSNSTPPLGPVVSVAMSEQDLENLLLPISSLDLKGFYFCWMSKAYHGLVELRLGDGAAISEAQLLSILTASPRLRILDIDLSITHSSQTDHEVAPVLLSDLETLLSGKRTLVELGALLRLILPGSRPIAIVIHKRLQPNSRNHPEQVLPVVRFFTHANLATISMAGSYTYFQIISLVRNSPSARVLVLIRLDLGSSEDNAKKKTTGSSHLDDLYIINTNISLKPLLWLMKSLHVQRLIITESSKVTLGDSILGKEQLHTAVSCLGCAFKSITSEEHYPMKQWS